MKFLPSLLLLFGIFAILPFKNSFFATALDSEPQDLQEIELLSDFDGSYIKATIFLHSSSQEYDIMLGLTNSQIILPAATCADTWLSRKYFKTIQTGKTPVDPSTPVMIEHPYFSAEGNPIDVPLEINSTRWNFTTTALLASDCESEFQAFESYKSGILGMGTEGSPKNSSKIFSISLNEYRTPGKLLFYFNSSFANSTPSAVFPADPNWQILNQQGSLVFGDHSIPFSGKIIFDISVEETIIPLAMWTSFFEKLKSRYKSCRPGSYRGILCPENPNLFSKRSSLRLVIDKKVLDLSSQFGVEEKGTFIYLTPSSTLNQGNQRYIRPLFRDAIILGGNFVRNFYPVFKSSQGSNTIELYQKRVVTETEEQESYLRTHLFGVVIAVGFLVIIFIVLLCHYIRNKKLLTSDCENSNQSYQSVVEEKAKSNRDAHEVL